MIKATDQKTAKNQLKGDIVVAIYTSVTQQRLGAAAAVS